MKGMEVDHVSRFVEVELHQEAPRLSSIEENMTMTCRIHDSEGWTGTFVCRMKGREDQEKAKAKLLALKSFKAQVRKVGMLKKYWLFGSLKDVVVKTPTKDKKKTAESMRKREKDLAPVKTIPLKFDAATLPTLKKLDSKTLSKRPMTPRRKSKATSPRKKSKAALKPPTLPRRKSKPAVKPPMS